MGCLPDVNLHLHAARSEGWTRPRSPTSYAMFAVAATLGGINVLAVRISVGELALFWAAGLRFSLAAIIFIVIALAMRLPWPRGRLLFLTIVNGLLGISLFYALAYWALVRVSAGQRLSFSLWSRWSPCSSPRRRDSSASAAGPCRARFSPCSASAGRR